jgi:hypothetical protein
MPRMKGESWITPNTKSRVVRQLIRINRYDAERDQYEADVLFPQDEVGQTRGSGSLSGAAGSH